MSDGKTLPQAVRTKPAHYKNYTLRILPPTPFFPIMPDLHSPEATATSSTHTPVRYRDRQTGHLITERVPGQTLLHWLYTTTTGQLLFHTLLNRRLCSRLCGWWQQSPWTRRQIRPFVERYRIDLDELAHPLDHYRSFNDFFIRRLKPTARPCDPDPTRLCCPADGKVLVYPKLATQARLPVKSCTLTARSLLAGALDPDPYQNGAALVVRLAPYDYHRFHFPADGQASSTTQVDGAFHSVNPLALAHVPDVFHRNRRAVCQLTTPHFGQIACVEVGALNVASIIQTYAPGPCQRGAEKGFFQFGGSTIVLLFEPGAIAFDEDLVTDSAAGLEVHVRTGAGVSRSA
jgi:phosphatidylserine decarboxylase